jgi:DNA-directed RNA polymerase specialized sigma24 family protein
VLKSGYTSKENFGRITDALCEQYLPRVFQYLNYWLKNPPIAEDLTLTALKRSLTRFRSRPMDYDSQSLAVFSAARHILRDYLHTNAHQLPPDSLSIPEREIMSLKFGARLANRDIARILGLTEAGVGIKLGQSLLKLKDTLQV